MDLDKPWVKNMTIDDLPNEDLKLIAGVIGLESTLKLAFNLGGAFLSIPKNVTRIVKRDYIKKHYDGTKKSRMELIRDCDISESYIYKVIKEE